MTPDFPVALFACSLLLFAGASCAPRWRYVLGGFLLALAFVPGIID